VACDDCGFPTGYYDTIEEAISAWNEINGVETETKSDKDLEIERLRKENEELKARIAKYERQE
jgi:uncharacterized protein YdcH (DUF465 family)